MASTGSAGSNSSSNGVTIPCDMHEKSYQYLSNTKYLVNGHRLWDDSESLTNQVQGIFPVLYMTIVHLSAFSVFDLLYTNRVCKPVVSWKFFSI